MQRSWKSNKTSPAKLRGRRSTMLPLLGLAALLAVHTPAAASAGAEATMQSSAIRQIGQPDPNRSFIYLLSCISFLSQDLRELALDACNHAVASNPKNADALRLRGSIYLGLGNAHRAILDYSLAIADEPANFTGYELRGHALVGEKRFAAALSDFNAAIKLAPRDAGAYAERGSEFQILGKFDPAIADFGRAISLAPKKADAWNARCWVRMLANTNLPAALADCRQALKMDAANPHYLDSIGWVYYRLGDSRDAVRSFDVGLITAPRFASSLYGRGLSRIAMGELRLGVDDIAAAKAIAPGIARDFAAYGIQIPDARVQPSVRTSADGAS